MEEQAISSTPKWKHYIELEPVRRLKNEGRELLGENIYVQLKYDGENVSMWLDENDVPHVASHNAMEARESIINQFKATAEYNKAATLLVEHRQRNHSNLILYGELVPAGKLHCRACHKEWQNQHSTCPRCGSNKIARLSNGPTHIERYRKTTRWYLFDIYNLDTNGYLPYTYLHQLAYHYKLPLIKAFEIFTPLNMDMLYTKIKELKALAYKRHREGVVLKVYKNGLLIGAKERIDLPKLTPTSGHARNSVVYPQMPMEKIIRALQHAWDEITSSASTDEDKIALWKNKAKAMPVIARHLNTEALEHYYSVPRNIYNIYLNTDINLIKPHPASSMVQSNE